MMLIPNAEHIMDKLPLDDLVAQSVLRHREEITKIIEGRDQRKILIGGPCSAFPDTAVIETAQYFKDLSNNFGDKIKFVFRCYTQKPRTTIGWPGPINQPDPFAAPDIFAGIMYCRRMMMDIAALDLAIADEAVFSKNEPYFGDLLSWVAIGARSAEDMEHRAHASDLGASRIAVGAKNPTSGHIPTGINSVVSMQHPHTISGDPIISVSGCKPEIFYPQKTTLGNPWAHLIMRGGNGKPNIDSQSIYCAAELIQASGRVKNPSIIVDLSHDNSYDISMAGKNYLLQVPRLLEVVTLVKSVPELDQIYKGFMIEAFIKSGSQKLESLTRQTIDLGGLSCTDACLGKAQVYELVGMLYDVL